jgi:hypothetical protein
MPEKDATPATGTARKRGAQSPEQAEAAGTEAAAPEQPPPDLAELEQLRARLIAQYRGRR